MNEGIGDEEEGEEAELDDVGVGGEAEGAEGGREEGEGLEERREGVAVGEEREAEEVAVEERRVGAGGWGWEARESADEAVVEEDGGGEGWMFSSGVNYVIRERLGLAGVVRRKEALC